MMMMLMMMKIFATISQWLLCRKRLKYSDFFSRFISEMWSIQLTTRQFGTVLTTAHDSRIIMPVKDMISVTRKHCVMDRYITAS